MKWSDIKRNQINPYWKRISRLERKIIFSTDVWSRLDAREVLSTIESDRLDVFG